MDFEQEIKKQKIHYTKNQMYDQENKSTAEIEGGLYAPVYDPCLAGHSGAKLCCHHRWVWV